MSVKAIITDMTDVFNGLDTVMSNVCVNHNVPDGLSDCVFSGVHDGTILK